MKRFSNIKKTFYNFIIVITVKKEKDLRNFLEEVQHLIKRKILIILYFDSTLDKETFFEAIKISTKNKNVIVKKDKSVKNLADAYFKAYKFASSFNCKWVISMNAGWRHDPKDLKKFFKLFNSKFLCVWGYRDNLSNKSNFLRKLVSILGNSLSNFFLSINIKDLTSGFYMIEKNVLKNKLLKMNGFISKSHFIDTELKYYLKNKKFTQVKIKYKSPNKQLPLKNIFDSLKTLLFLFLKRII